MRHSLFLGLLTSFFFISSCKKSNINQLSSKVVIIQPIVTQSDLGKEPAKIETSLSLVNNCIL